MEFLCKIGRNIGNPYLVRLQLVDKIVSHHPVVRIKLFQLRREKRILHWSLGQRGHRRRWEYPTEGARTINDCDEEILRDLQNYVAAPREKKEDL